MTGEYIVDIDNTDEEVGVEVQWPWTEHDAFRPHITQESELYSAIDFRGNRWNLKKSTSK